MDVEIMEEMSSVFKLGLRCTGNEPFGWLGHYQDCST